MEMSKKAYNRFIYPRTILENAACAYSGIADISVIADGDTHICAFSKCDVPVSLVISEFGNYLIEMLNNRNDIL